jgi:hypothetical protein
VVLESEMRWLVHADENAPFCRDWLRRQTLSIRFLDFLGRRITRKTQQLVEISCTDSRQIRQELQDGPPESMGDNHTAKLDKLNALEIMDPSRKILSNDKSSRDLWDCRCSYVLPSYA